MKKFTVFLCGVVLVFGLASNAGATLHEGGLTAGDGLFGTGSWIDASLGWAVDDVTNPGYWTYVYTWTGPEKKDLSHIDIEVSLDLNFDEIIHEWSADKAIEVDSPEGPTVFSEECGDIYGIKWDLDEATTELELTLVSARMPMWGDFYAKGGKEEDEFGNKIDLYAYNTGFGSDTMALIGDGNALDDGKAWVLVPDTAPIPEPATMMLFGCGLIGLCVFGRKKFFKKT